MDLLDDVTLRNRARARELLATGEARALRLAAGVTLEEAGDEAGVTATTICRWELGGRKPLGEAGARYGTFLERLQRQVGDPAVPVEAMQ